MTLTNRFCGSLTAVANKTVQDFGLCDLKGNYLNTIKIRPKGLLVVLFFDPNSSISVQVVKTVKSWSEEVPMDKWTGLLLSGANREELNAFEQKQDLTKVSILIDNEYYQHKMWGISNLPTLFLVSGKTGRVLQRVVGADVADLGAMKNLLLAEIGKIVAAEQAAAEAAKKAEEEKKAAAALAAAAAPAKAAA